MPLPGGIAAPTGLNRSYQFKPLTGAVELSIAEALEEAGNWPQRITEALVAALEEVGGLPADRNLIHDLALGDRQFLVRRFGILISGDEAWLTSSCGHCGEQLQVRVRYSELPVKEAEEGFPYVEVLTSRSNKPLRFRIPSGRDQEEIQATAQPEEVRQVLAQRLLAGESEGEFSERDLDLIERAVEEGSPEIGTELSVICPACEKRAVVRLDPWAPLRGDLTTVLLQEVDKLAWHYHWSESDILALPRQRRRRYLSLIDQHRGMRSVESLRGAS